MFYYRERVEVSACKIKDYASCYKQYSVTKLKDLQKAISLAQEHCNSRNLTENHSLKEIISNALVI